MLAVRTEPPLLNGNSWTDVYLVALDVDPVTGLAGVEFGLQYTPYPYAGGSSTGLYLGSWQLCADLDFEGPGFPGAGSENVITFAGCQNTPDPTDPEGKRS